MKRVKSLMLSGFVGIGIGMIWYIFLNLAEVGFNMAKRSDISFSNLVFWIVITFFIGVAFNLGSQIFKIEQWSFKKQLIVNFFIFFVVWSIFYLIITGFRLSLLNWLYLVISFVVIYLSGCGAYFLHLKKDVATINDKLKKNKL